MSGGVLIDVPFEAPPPVPERLVYADLGKGRKYEGAAWAPQPIEQESLEPEPSDAEKAETVREAVVLARRACSEVRGEAAREAHRERSVLEAALAEVETVGVSEAAFRMAKQFVLRSRTGQWAGSLRRGGAHPPAHRPDEGESAYLGDPVKSVPNAQDVKEDDVRVSVERSLAKAGGESLTRVPMSGAASKEEAFAKAHEANGDFQALLDKGEGVDAAIGAHAYVDDAEMRWLHDAEHPRIVVVAPVKSEKSAESKVSGKYGGDWGRIFDMVRGSVVTHSADDISKAIEATIGEAEKRGWSVAKAEDRMFAKNGSAVHVGSPGGTGYRDAQVILQHPNGMGAEVQFLCRKMVLAKEGEGHRLYEQQRAITRAAAEAGRNLTPAEQAEVERLRDAQSAVYGEAWNEALR